MKTNKQYLIWMNCYGGWAPDLRRPIETTGYDSYLNSFVEKVSSLKNNIKAIYISGGMYDSLNRMECETVKPELEKRFKKLGLNFSINTDENSITSVDIMDIFLKTWKNRYFDTTPILFVDEPRYEINCFTFKHFCQKYGIDNLKAEDVIIPLARQDDNPHSTPGYQAQKLTLMKESGVEFVNSLEREKRKEHLKGKKNK